MATIENSIFFFKRNKRSFFSFFLLVQFVLSVTSVISELLSTDLGHTQLDVIMRDQIILPHWLQKRPPAKELEYKEGKKVKNVRLPKNIKPLEYLVRLRPYINGNCTIDGHVEMTFEALEETMNVTLHINDIITKNETIKITSSGKGTENARIKSHQYDQGREFYIAHLEEPLKKNQVYVISIDFVGLLNTQLYGFYRSSYKDEKGQTRWLATTQFQATSARNAFPCMDEPRLKANFTIELGRQENLTSLSNMPLRETVQIEGELGWFWDKFEKSVKMSTYLVAFVISDLKYLESKSKMNYIFKVWAREDAIQHAEYAIKIGPQISKFFEGFFKIPFPLPKQDMIAIPDFSAYAMENWGLITYKETALLFEPHSTTSNHKLSLSTTIAHELAHQWFGNLVTPEWWTDLWLNEGFATYMQYIGLSEVEPTWKLKELFIVNNLHSVLGLDCLESSHPINIPVEDPNEIDEIFDTISYFKGSSIIRMMSNFLTENTFRNGLSKYLTELAYKSAVQDDLWHYLTQQAHEDGTLDRNLSVKEIMDTWTLQMGYPVLTVTNHNNGTATLMKERFLLVKTNSSSNSPEYKWWIPVTYTSQNNPDFSITNPKLWMKPSESQKTIELPMDGWVILNNKQTGYYRVNYDARNYELIINQLLTDHTLIDPINRAQIIDDSMTLARAGFLPYETAFKILSYLKKESEYIPWSAALNNLSFIKDMFQHSGCYGALREFSLSLVSSIYEKLGFKDNMDDPLLDQFKRVQILTQACYMDYKPCAERSAELFKSWMNDPDNSSIISPDMKSFVICKAIGDGGYDEWKFTWDRYEMSNVPSERNLLLSVLGCSEKTWILNGYLNRAFEEGKGIRKQDAISVVTSVSRGSIGRIVAFKFLKEKFLHKRVLRCRYICARRNHQILHDDTQHRKRN